MTPEQEEQVRRALAAVARPEDGATARQDAGQREDPPLPPDVAARLDTVLAELVAPRVPAAAPAADDELAQRRRRRWPNTVVAAAAVCVIAFAGGAVATGGFGLANNSSTDSQQAGSTADSGSVGSPGGDTRVPSTQPRELGATGNAPTLRTDTLTRDITRLVDRPGALPSGSPPRWRCVAPPLRAGEQVLGVRLDGRRSSLVLGVPTAGARTARVYSCADPNVLVASTTVHSSAP